MTRGLGQLLEVSPEGIRIALRQTLRWARAAEQDRDPFVQALHANYAVGNLDQLRQLASDSEILAATGLDPAILALRFARLQDEAAAAIGLEGRRGMTVPLSRRGETLGQGFVVVRVTVPDPATGKLVEVPADQPFLPSGEPNRIIRISPFELRQLLPAAPVVPPVLEPERTVQPVFVTRPAERPQPARMPPGAAVRRAAAPARFTPEEAPPGILFRFFGGARPAAAAPPPAAAQAAFPARAPAPPGLLFRFFQGLFPGRGGGRGTRVPAAGPPAVRALGQGEFFLGFPEEEAPAAAPAERPGQAGPVVVAARGDTGPRVRRVQELLRTLALPVGRVDGVYGALTEQAVRLFQQDAGLPVTGEVDGATLAALEAAVAAAAPPAGAPLPPGETRRRTFPLPGQAPPGFLGLSATQLGGLALVGVVLLAAGGGAPRGSPVPRPGTIETVPDRDQQTYVRAVADGDLVLVRRLLAKYPEVPRREWAKLAPLPPGL